MRGFPIRALARRDFHAGIEFGDVPIDLHQLSKFRVDQLVASPVRLANMRVVAVFGHRGQEGNDEVGAQLPLQDEFAQDHVVRRPGEILAREIQDFALAALTDEIAIAGIKVEKLARIDRARFALGQQLVAQEKQFQHLGGVRDADVEEYQVPGRLEGAQYLRQHPCRRGAEADVVLADDRRAGELAACFQCLQMAEITGLLGRRDRGGGLARQGRLGHNRRNAPQVPGRGMNLA